VLGEAGLGKTRLAFELGRLLEARLPGARVLELRAREPLGSDADETIAALLRRALQLPPAIADAESGFALLRQRLGARAADTVPAAALALRWIAPDHPAVQALQAAAGVLR